MGLFNSLTRFFANLLGFASGTIDEANDAMVSGSPAAIRAQFRKTKENWLKQYNEMRDAISQLMVIREQKKNEMEQLQKEEDDLVMKMEGALNEAEKDPQNPSHSAAYERFFGRKQEIDQRQEILEKEINQSEQQLSEYKQRLTNLQNEIKKLDQEEAETIADMISSQKIIELNDRLNNLSTDNISQSLSAIREKRAKLKSQANLSNELSKTDVKQIDEKYKVSGKSTAAGEAFAKAMALRQKQKGEETQKDSQTEKREL